METSVVKKGDRWTAEFTFHQRARAWAFRWSGVTDNGKKPWRPLSWSIETPGVMLERRGEYDVLISVNGKDVPRKVVVRFAPFARVLLGEYDPALRFSDGSIALFTQQFNAFPVNDVAKLSERTRTYDGIGVLTRFRDTAKPLLYLGQRRENATIIGDQGGYILFGPIQPVQTPTMSMIVDPQLPVWIGNTLRRTIPKVIDSYTAALGAPAGSRPTIMVSWAGATHNSRRMSGSVLPDLVTMTFEGDQLLSENNEARNYALWFIAHETAHFWLGNLVRDDGPNDSWIFEGGADLLAFRSVAAAEPSYNWRGEINRSIAECALLVKNRGVSSAWERKEMRTYYSCGVVFGLVAENASGQSFAQFLKSLIDANRDDKILTRAEWLAHLDKTSSNPALSQKIRMLLDKGSDDPQAAIAALFKQAGLAYTLTPDGLPVI